MGSAIIPSLLVVIAIAVLILNRNRRLRVRSRRNRQPGRSRDKSPSARSRAPRGGVVRSAGRPLRAELSIGWSAGSELYHKMKNARASVRVVSPYLDEPLVDCLLTLRGQGVVVDLAIMEDFASSRVKKHKIATKLVSQTPSRDESAVTRRRRGMLGSALGGVGAAGIAIGLNGVFPWAPLGWFLLPVAAIVFAIYRRRGIYRYNYAWTLGDTIILPSHYQSDTECPFVHAKVYVIDSEVAFLGSLNFTTTGMFDNFETCFRVDNPDDVRAIESLINSQISEIESWSLAPSDVGAWLVNARILHEQRAVGRGELTSRGQDVVGADTESGVRGDAGVYTD